MRSNSKLLSNILRTALTSATLFVGAGANAQWTTVGKEGFMVGGNTWEHMFFDSLNVPYVSFSNSHGQVMRYADTGWTSIGSANITDSTASDSWATMASNGDIYFSYADAKDSSQATVKLYHGSSWTTIGSNLSDSVATYTNVVVSSKGTPYVSYLDKGSSPATLNVKMYDGTKWKLVGGVPVTTDESSYPSLAIDHNDTLYIAYQDVASTQNVIVKKFDGTNWNVVGGGAFSAQPSGGAYFLSLAIDHNNVPYVAYMSPYHGPSVCVSKLDGSSWSTVGTASFSPVSSLFISLAIDSKNMPYVTYVDNSVSGKASVMKYDGSSWANIDTPGFSTNAAVYTSIAIDGNDNPYIAFLDAGTGGTTVMKYPVCNPSDKATVTVSDTLICKGSSVTLNASGTLNDAKKWFWYSDSLKGKAVDSGSSVTLMPGDTTIYYVRGGGGCVLSSAASMVTVDVDSVAKPSISVASSVLTSSASSGNQWYGNGTAISGATGNSYTATTSGWYMVQVTNSNHCSSMSDSVFVTGLGVAQISNDANINVYPSPFAETVHIDFVSSQYNAAGTVVYITDNMGRKVFEQKGLEQKNTISLTALPSGIYFINLVTSENSEVLRVVKQ